MIGESGTTRNLFVIFRQEAHLVREKPNRHWENFEPWGGEKLDQERRGVITRENSD